MPNMRQQNDLISIYSYDHDMDVLDEVHSSYTCPNNRHAILHSWNTEEINNGGTLNLIFSRGL